MNDRRAETSPETGNDKILHPARHFTNLAARLDFRGTGGEKGVTIGATFLMDALGRATSI